MLLGLLFIALPAHADPAAPDRTTVRATDPAATPESLYVGTVEGLSYPDLRARSVQFHPEAGPGPHDAWPILAEWVEEVQLAAA
jgi:carbamoyl-phosphate synthase small subunit